MVRKNKLVLIVDRIMKFRTLIQYLLLMVSFHIFNGLSLFSFSIYATIELHYSTSMNGFHNLTNQKVIYYYFVCYINKHTLKKYNEFTAIKKRYLLIIMIISLAFYEAKMIRGSFTKPNYTFTETRKQCLNFEANLS